MIRTILLTIAIGLSGDLHSDSETTADWLLTHALHGNENYIVLAQRSADVTFDEKPETLIAFKNVTDENAPVPFFIVGKPGQKRTILLRNDALVQCKQCGGIFTDHGEFVINQQGVITFTGPYGSRQRGEHSVSIRFDRTSQRWLVSAASYSWYDSLDPNANNPGALGSWCINANDFPTAFPADSIKESTWDVLDSFRHDAYYQVAVDRVPFSRSCPDEDKPNAYLTKGDVVESKYRLKDKIGCEYTVKNTRTRGFLPKSALTKITVSDLSHNDFNFTIGAPKVHFHSAPNSTARLATFVVKGDSLTCHYRVSGYTYCSFEKVSKDDAYTENIRYYGFFRNDAIVERVKSQ